MTLFKIIKLFAKIKLFFNYFTIESIDLNNNYEITYSYFSRQQFKSSPLMLMKSDFIKKFRAEDAFLIGVYAAKLSNQ